MELEKMQILIEHVTDCPVKGLRSCISRGGVGTQVTLLIVRIQNSKWKKLLPRGMGWHYY